MAVLHWQKNVLRQPLRYTTISLGCSFLLEVNKLTLGEQLLTAAIDDDDSNWDYLYHRALAHLKLDNATGSTLTQTSHSKPFKALMSA
jgi:hypothetical protein